MWSERGKLQRPYHPVNQNKVKETDKTGRQL